MYTIQDVTRLNYTKSIGFYLIISDTNASPEMESGKDVAMKNAPPEDTAQCSENVSVPKEGEVTKTKPEPLTSVSRHVLSTKLKRKTVSQNSKVSNE
jgi:hypothetical protein